ncbi:MAG TPA: CAP domain-containing protein [Candidatus Dojkabacteria bacterium]|nr:CAP domain-containing protein [Candidatus Dojkabacteria bacterium]
METKYFTQKKSSQKRNKILNLVYVFSILILIVFSSFALKQTFASNISSDLLIQLTNSERKSSNIPLLKLDNRLTMAAYIKAYDMLDKQYWAHYGPSGENPWSYILYCNYDYTVAGENLAYDFSDSFKVHQSWMSSELHKKNILNASYTHIGIAIVDGFFQGKETTLVVQLFGSETNSSESQNYTENLEESIKILYPQEQSKINGMLHGVVGITKYNEDQKIHVSIDDESIGTSSISNGTFSIRTQYDKEGIHRLIAELNNNGKILENTEINFEIINMGSNSIKNIYIDNDNMLKIPYSEDIIDVKVISNSPPSSCPQINNEIICNMKDIEIPNAKLVIVYTNDRSVTLPVREIYSLANNSTILATTQETTKTTTKRYDSLLVPIALTGLGVFELIRYSFTPNKTGSSGYKVFILLIGAYAYLTSKIGIII